MSVHRLMGLRVGVPRPEELAAFYDEMGLGRAGSGRVTSPDGGTQVTIEEAPFRRLLGVEVGASDPAGLDGITRQMAMLGITTTGRSSDGAISVTDPTTQIKFNVLVAERLVQAPSIDSRENRPGATIRSNRRADGVFPAQRPPRRLGHMVIGTPDIAATQRFLVDGLGFKVSDKFDGVISFLRCSTDHHNIGLVETPVPLLQHYSWECEDVDHVGHNATALLRADPERHVWGFGRHFVGSNFFWYLRDPAGSFVEFYSDMDVIDDDDDWDHHGRTEVTFEHVANSWGPSIPLEFIVPADLEHLQAGWASLS